MGRGKDKWIRTSATVLLSIVSDVRGIAGWFQEQAV